MFAADLHGHPIGFIQVIESHNRDQPRVPDAEKRIVSWQFQG
jgi:hypothetical protein